MFFTHSDNQLVAIAFSHLSNRI